MRRSVAQTLEPGLPNRLASNGLVLLFLIVLLAEDIGRTPPRGLRPRRQLLPQSLCNMAAFM
jgi:hypothetical protein